MNVEPQAVDQLAEAIRHVRMAYDKYFMGLERLEPLKQREAARKLLQQLLGATQRNTAQKFRLQALQASWLTWETYWNRIAQQIEEGTFKRDKQKAIDKLQGGAKAPPLAAGPLPPSKPVAGVVADLPQDISQDTIAKLHAAFAKARAELGLAPGGTSLPALAATVTKQAAAIKAQYKCQSVEFKVAIKDGRPILKATPR